MSIFGKQPFSARSTDHEATSAEASSGDQATEASDDASDQSQKYSDDALAESASEPPAAPESSEAEVQEAASEAGYETEPGEGIGAEYTQGDPDGTAQEPTEPSEEASGAGWVTLDEVPQRPAEPPAEPESLDEPDVGSSGLDEGTLEAVEPDASLQWTEIGDGSTESPTDAADVAEEDADVVEAIELQGAGTEPDVGEVLSPLPERREAAPEAFEGPRSESPAFDTGQNHHIDAPLTDESPQTEGIGAPSLGSLGVPTVAGAAVAAGATRARVDTTDPDSFSALLRDMSVELSASHEELQPDVQPVIDERDAVLASVDEAQDPAGLESILFDGNRQFPQHITWLRHAGGDISRLRRAELESDDALASLSRLRQMHLTGGIAEWSTALEPARGRPSKQTGVRDEGDSAARFGTLRLAATAADKGPAALERLLRGFRRGLQIRQAGRWLTRLIWVGVIAALGLAWARGLVPYAAYGAAAAAVLWLVQEFVVNPRLDQRHFERLRTRTRDAIGDYYAARLIALLEMGVIRSQLGRMDD